MRLNEDKKCIELTIHSLTKHMCPVEDGFPKHVPIQKKKKKKGTKKKTVEITNKE
jgi:hypothetical protein